MAKSKTSMTTRPSIRTITQTHGQRTKIPCAPVFIVAIGKDPDNRVAICCSAAGNGKVLKLDATGMNTNCSRGKGNCFQESQFHGLGVAWDCREQGR